MMLGIFFFDKPSSYDMKSSQENCNTLSAQATKSSCIVSIYKCYSLVFHFSCFCCRSVTKSCPTLSKLVDCSMPGSSVHEILQARILEWVAMLSSRGSAQPRDRTHVSWVSKTQGRSRLNLQDWQVGFLPLAPPGKPTLTQQPQLTFSLPSNNILKAHPHSHLQLALVFP